MQPQLIFHPIVWVRATKFRELMGLTIDEYNVILKKFVTWGKSKIIRKKGKHTYINLLSYNEWVEDHETN